MLGLPVRGSELPPSPEASFGEGEPTETTLEISRSLVARFSPDGGFLCAEAELVGAPWLPEGVDWFAHGLRRHFHGEVTTTYVSVPSPEFDDGAEGESEGLFRVDWAD